MQVELAAVNYVYSEVSDVDGAKLDFREIVPGSPRVVHSTLPVGEIVEKCGARRLLPVRPSVHHPPRPIAWLVAHHATSGPPHRSSSPLVA